MMRAIRFLFSGFALCALAVVWAACGGSEQAAPPPNIVVILADDMGYGDPGAWNPDSKVPTPHIDRLAAEGMRFTDAHSPSAVCTPTRYGLLTGRYAWRTRLTQGVLVGYSPNLIDTTRLTLPGMLRQAGYATAGIGKWHLGLGDAERTDYAQPLRPGPVSLGFDYYFGIPSSLDFEPYVWFENDRVEQLPTDSIEASRPCCKEDFYRGGGIAPDFRHVDVLPRTVEKSVEYVMQAGDKPFFLYVPFSAPHTPWLPTEPFQGSSGAGTYGDFAVQVDAGVGDILNALDEAGVAENTLVVFTSDNGAHWLPYEIEMFDHRANLDWRGMKADIYEGGHRVPFVARWPGRIEAGSVSHELISLVDLMATFASVTGQMLPDDAGEDSYDLTPVLLGESRGRTHPRGRRASLGQRHIRYPAGLLEVDRRAWIGRFHTACIRRAGPGRSAGTVVPPWRRSGRDEQPVCRPPRSRRKAIRLARPVPGTGIQPPNDRGPRSTLI